jgi:hypothetical protein
MIGRLRYGAAAVALALFDWGYQGRAGSEVQSDIAPSGPSPYSKLHGWRQLRRWARAASLLWWKGLRLLATEARQRAVECIPQLAAHSIHVEMSLIEMACDGAQRA